MALLTDTRLDFDWITDQLAIGGRYPMEAAFLLAREHRVRYVVDVRAECCDDEGVLRRHGIELLHLPAPDLEELGGASLEHGVAWVSQLVANRRRVLVHCEHGIGSSALLVLCVLVERGMAPLDALLLARNRRERVSPSPRQLEAFIAFSRDVASRRNVAWELPTFDALAAIAYRHLNARRTELHL